MVSVSNIAALLLSIWAVVAQQVYSDIAPIQKDGLTTQKIATEICKAPLKLGLLTNFADPAIHWDAPTKTWYAFGTNQEAGILGAESCAGSDPSNALAITPSNIQIATSKDFREWTLQSAGPDPLPNPGKWTKQGVGDPYNMPVREGNQTCLYTSGKSSTVQVALANVWAPELLRRPSDGKFVMYYAAADGSSHAHCIGAAVASSPSGPYTPQDKAIICPANQGGAIDAGVFIDETDKHTIYLTYKVDGNGLGHGGECGNMVAPIHSTPIMLQKMATDGITPASKSYPLQILDRTAEDGPLVEAPQLVKAGTMYFLFYSSGCTRNNDYTVRYAWAYDLTGPYNPAPKPLFATGDFGLTAPGSASVRYSQAWGQSTTGPSGASQSGQWKVALHGRVNSNIGGVRALFVAGLEFNGTMVKVVNGTASVV